MHSPHEGRFTSGYGRRGSSFHAGLDIAPPKAGTVGTPVYAAFAGTVERVVTGREAGQPASRGRVLAAGRSGNGVIVRNPDRERQVYNHVDPAVRAGQHVREGQLIGHTDRSGIQTGPHLHFETWNRAGRAFDPLVLFRKYGVKVGSAPASPSEPPAHTDEHTLARGSRGKAVKALQRELNRWKTSLPKLRVDGNYGALTERRVAEWQRRNHGGAYPAWAAVDGIAGPVTLDALGLD